MVKLALLLLGVCFIGVAEPIHTYALINLSLLLVMYMNRVNDNVVHLCSVMLLVYLVESFVFQFFMVQESDVLSDMAVNAYLFLMHFTADLILFVLITLRPALSRSWLEKQGKSSDHIFIYNTEFALTSLMLVFMLVDLLALVENATRHLTEFGVSAGTADIFSGWNWFFYNYAPVKAILLGLTFLFLWTINVPGGQDKYKAVEAG